MWPFNKLARLLWRKQAVTTAVFGGGSAQWSKRDYTTFSREGYEKNAVVYRAVSLVSRALASVPWGVYSGPENDAKELQDHPLGLLLEQPNKRQSGSALLENLSSFHMIAGNAYLRRLGPDDGPPSELHSMRPDRMTILSDSMGMITGYVYTVNNKKHMFPVDPVTKECEILHICSFHPLNDWYGMSGLEAAAYAVDQHNAGSEWNYKLLKNSARPCGAFTYKPGEMAEGSLSPEQFARLQRQINEGRTGSENAGRPMLLEGGLEWQEMGLSPKDMDWIQGRNISAREIAVIFGVAPMLVGVLGDATFANYFEARLSLWEDTVVPRLVLYRDELNRWLAPLFGDDIWVDFNLDDVPALTEKRQSVWQKLETVTFLTYNEKREAIGYEPVDGGDVILVPAMNIPLGEGGEDTEEEQSAAGRASILSLTEAADIGYGKSLTA